MVPNYARRSRRRGLRTIIVLAVALCLGAVAPAGGGVAVAAPTASAATAATAAGWPGGLAAFQGRYHLTASSSSSFATSGTLTIFGRVVPRQPHPVMSGILSLYAKTGTTVLYLTQFVHLGKALSAQVNAGLFTGPKIGVLHVQQHAGAELVTGFVLGQAAVISLHFTRFSSNPHP